MPVRIYDISKKLGLENKEIISKAKALGIAAAKVPSSSLDKISAEWLEEELIKDFPEVAARLAPKPAPEPPKPAPAEEKIVLITAPPPEPKPEVKAAPAGGRNQNGKRRIRSGSRGRGAKNSARTAQTRWSSSRRQGRLHSTVGAAAAAR